MTFKVILEDNWTNKLTFATVEDCKDMDDLINHIHAEDIKLILGIRQDCQTCCT